MQHQGHQRAEQHDRGRDEIGGVHAHDVRLAGRPQQRLPLRPQLSRHHGGLADGAGGGIDHPRGKTPQVGRGVETVGVPGGHHAAQHRHAHGTAQLRRGLDEGRHRSGPVGATLTA